MKWLLAVVLCASGCIRPVINSRDVFDIPGATIAVNITKLRTGNLFFVYSFKNTSTHPVYLERSIHPVWNEDKNVLEISHGINMRHHPNMAANGLVLNQDSTYVIKDLIVNKAPGDFHLYLRAEYLVIHLVNDQREQVFNEQMFRNGDLHSFKNDRYLTQNMIADTSVIFQKF